MSTAIMKEVWKLNIEKSAKFVLVKIADNTNEITGIGDPSIPYLAACCCMSERTVQRSLRDFLNSGVLVIVGHKKGGRRPREYVINLEKARKIHGIVDVRSGLWCNFATDDGGGEAGGGAMSARHKTAFGRRAEFYDRIVSDARLSRAAIAVAWRLVNHVSDQSGECLPSVERLAGELNINERAVRRGVDQLITAGWFTKNGGVLELAEGS